MNTWELCYALCRMKDMSVCESINRANQATGQNVEQVDDEAVAKKALAILECALEQQYVGQCRN